MIDINGALYPWSHNSLTRVARRLLNGDILTTVPKEKKAYINLFRKDQEEVSLDYAELIIKLGWVEADSGNFETGERHYKIIDKYE